MPSVARFHTRASSISATETLKPRRRVSLMDRTTCRLSLRDCACWISISSVSTATGTVVIGRGFGCEEGDGRGERIRTSDPLVPNQVRYQTALRPETLAG